MLYDWISFGGIFILTAAFSVRNVEIREEREILSRTDQMEEFIFLGLRLSEGISRKDFLDTFHQDFDHTCGACIDSGNLCGVRSERGLCRVAG